MPNPSELERVEQERQGPQQLDYAGEPLAVGLTRDKIIDDRAWGRAIIDHYRWQWQRFWSDPREWLAIKIAWMLPKRVALWAMIRVAAHATTGRWGNEHPASVAYPEMHDRWSIDNG